MPYMTHLLLKPRSQNDSKRSLRSNQHDMDLKQDVKLSTKINVVDINSAFVEHSVKKK